MQIHYLGHSCFKLIGKDDSGNQVVVVCDPFGKHIGLKMPSTEADIITVSHHHDDHDNVAGVKGGPYVIDTPGEYEVKSVFIQGIDSYHDDKEGKERGSNVMYRLRMEDLSLAHLGDLGHLLDSKQLERLEGTDIIFIPVGGTYTIDAKQAIEVVHQIEPRIIIPMHYNVPGLKVPKAIDGVDKFLKEIGVTPTEEEKMKITRRDLPQEDMEVVIFKR